MCAFQKFAFDPVMHHEEPTANPLPGCVQGVACDCLLNLNNLCPGIGDKEIAEMCAAIEFLAQLVTSDAQQGTWQLHESTIKGFALVKTRKKAKGAFPADIDGLDGRAVLQYREQRKDGPLRKIGLIEDAARLAYDVATPRFDSFKAAVDSPAAGAVEGLQQPVPRCGNVLLNGHERTPNIGRSSRLPIAFGHNWQVALAMIMTLARGKQYCPRVFTDLRIICSEGHRQASNLYCILRIMHYRLSSLDNDGCVQDACEADIESEDIAIRWMRVVGAAWGLHCDWVSMDRGAKAVVSPGPIWNFSAIWDTRPASPREPGKPYRNGRMLQFSPVDRAAAGIVDAY